MRIPSSLWWLFPDVEARDLDADRDADFVLARVLERGRMQDVRYCVGHYGLERIHRFFRDVGHPELSARTIRFWRLLLDAEDEPWVTSPSWRRSSGAPWPG